MRILITGYKGFIGSNLAIYLQDQGHDVEGWDYRPNTIPDPSSYDWVVHCGGISDTTYTDVNQIMEQNTEYTIRLLQVCDTMGTNFQYASSASVYGSNSEFKEDSPPNPQSPYAWSKYIIDRFLEQHKLEFDIQVQGLRYFNVYGFNESHKGDQASPFTKFTDQAIETGTVKIFEGSENFKRDFISVEDVCKVHEKLFDIHENGIYNVGTGNAVSFKEVADVAAKVYDATVEEIPMPDALKLKGM